MKTGQVLLIGAAGLAAYYFANLGIATGTMNFVFSGIKINSINDFVFTITMQNVSNADLNVNSMSGNILLNGDSFANISDFTKRTIPGNSQADIDVHIKPQLFSLSTQIQNLINNPGSQLSFTINGNANVNGLVLPFSIEETYNFN